MCENCNAFSSASESKKGNPLDRSLDLSFFFLYDIVTFRKTLLLLHGATICPSGFGATFAALLVWNC